MHLDQLEVGEAEFRRAEFAALRAEIDRRSGVQERLITLTLTAFGTLTGIALSRPAIAADLMSTLAIISSAAGLLWLDQDRAIQMIGDYIRDELWPSNLPTFETREDKRARDIAEMGLEVFAPVIAVIALPPAIGLWWVRAAAGHLLWDGGVVALAAYVVYVFVHLRKRRKNARRIRRYVELI